MAGVNKVILVGRLGRDPEIRYFQDGTAVCNFSIATSETWNDRNTGEKKEKTEWHRIVAFRKLGELCGQYLAKGRQVYVEGKLQTRSYEKDGQTHYATEIVASTVQFLGGRENGPYQGNNQGGGFQQGGGQGGGFGGGQMGGGQGGPARQAPDDQFGGGFDGGPDNLPDDDIPF